MDFKLKTLEQIHQAQDEIADKLADPGLSFDARKSLEQASSVLRNSERAIVKTIQQEIIDSLNNDVKPLNDLVEEMKKSAENLAEVAGKIEKAAKGIAALITILETAIKAGLI